MLHHKSREDTDHDARDVDHEDHLAGVFGTERGGEENPDRKLGAAAHERRHEDGQEPVAFRFQDARRHDGRNRAAESDEHRHERLAGKPDPAHETVHHERRARHVAGVFENRQAQEHESDRRQERGHRLERGTDAVGYYRDQPLRSVEFREKFRAAAHEKRVTRYVEEIDERASDDLRHPEDEIH